MENDLISRIRRRCNEAMSTPSGNSTLLQLSVSEVGALLKTIEEQEVELLKAETTLTTLKDNVKEFVELLDCSDFNEEEPTKEDHGKLFEVFVGDSVSDMGRLFAVWDSNEKDFAMEDEEGGVMHIENVLFWRTRLPEPFEAIEIKGLD